MTEPVLVTGGAGFIGSHLVEKLVERGERVVLLDNFGPYYPEAAKRSNIGRSLGSGLVTLVTGDVRDPEALRAAITDHGVSRVAHLAARPGVRPSLAAPEPYLDINVGGTLNLLTACRDYGVRKVVFASSSSVYGGTSRPADEETTPCRPLSPYAASKVAGEAMLTAFSHSYGISTVALRYFNVFGPRPDPKSAYAAAISAFGEALINGHRPTIFGDGKQTRDFVYIANVVHANLLAASSDKPLGGDVFNVGMGEHVSLLEILDQMGEWLKIDVDPVFEEPRAGDVRHSLADVSRTRDQFGYEPIVSFEDGLQLTLEWMKTQST